MPTINEIKGWLRDAPHRRELRRRQDWVARPGDHFYARDVSDCPVKVWMRRTGNLPPLADVPKSRNLTLMSRGNWLEKEVLTSLREFNPGAQSGVGALRKSYLKHDPPFVLSGRPDLLDWPVLYEIKSIGQERFNEFRRLEDVYQNYQDQIQVYLDLFKCTEGYLVLVSRDDAKYRVFRVLPDEDRMNFLLHKMADLEDKIQSGVMPEQGDCWTTCPCRSEDDIVEGDTSS